MRKRLLGVRRRHSLSTGSLASARVEGHCSDHNETRGPPVKEAVPTVAGLAPNAKLRHSSTTLANHPVRFGLSLGGLMVSTLTIIVLLFASLYTFRSRDLVTR